MSEILDSYDRWLMLAETASEDPSLADEVCELYPNNALWFRSVVEDVQTCRTILALLEAGQLRSGEFCRMSVVAWDQPVRQAIKERDEYCCSYCSGKGGNWRGPDGKSWHIDHATPLSWGGYQTSDNLRLACATCNRRKGNMDAEEYAAYSLHGAGVEQ